MRSILLERTTLWCFAVFVGCAGYVKAANIDGTVVDENNKPIEGAVVKVFASRPLTKIQKVVPCMHEHCSIQAKTDSLGRFKLANLDETHEVVLVAWKKDHLMTRSAFVSVRDFPPVALTLKTIESAKLPAKFIGHLKNQTGMALANAVVGYEDMFRFPEPEDYNRMGKAIAVMTDESGRFELPSEVNSYPGSFCAIIPNIGKRDLRLSMDLLPQVTHEWTIAPSAIVTGRIVDELGPVPDYHVCIASASSFNPHPFLLVASTDSDGRFMMDGVPGGYDPSQLFCIFGDISQKCSRGHLETKLFDSSDPGMELDFGDLKLRPVTSVRLQLDLNGGEVEDQRANLELSLRQKCRPLKFPIPRDGVVELDNIPLEVMRWNVYAGRKYRYASTNPFQKAFNDSDFYFAANDSKQMKIIMEKLE